MTRSVAVFVAGIVTITFLTLLMLLEGQRWVDRTIEMLPASAQPTWRSIADDIYQLVGRFVTGNLLISLIAATTTAIVLLVLGVPAALALGLLVAILDLIPLAGATLVTLVAIPAGGTIQILLEHSQTSRRPSAGDDGEPVGEPDSPRADRPARTRKRAALP